MTIFQLFQNHQLTGIAAYPDRQKIFDMIGTTLKGAAARQLQNCVDQLASKDDRFLPLIEMVYLQRLEAAGLDMTSVQPPTSEQDWVARATKAAVAARYDGNLDDETSARLVREYDARAEQYNKILAQIKSDDERYRKLDDAFGKKYEQYRCQPFFSNYHKELSLCQDSDTIFDAAHDSPDKLYYDLRPDLSAQFKSDNYELQVLGNKIDSQENALQLITSEALAIKRKIDALVLPSQGDNLTLEVLKEACGAFRAQFTDEVLKDFESSITNGTPPVGTLFALETPTIVMSNNGRGVCFEKRFVGGHNAERIRYDIQIDPALAKGQFVSSENTLRISPADVDHLDNIAASMARVSGADAKTQARAFTDATAGDARSNADRLAALGIPSGNIRVKGVETTSVSLEANPGGAADVNEIRIGRSAEDGHLYLTNTTHTETLRTRVYGHYALPEIIASRSVEGALMQVRLDSSLSPREVETIVGNYISAGPRTQAGGGGRGGWRIPPSQRLAEGPERDRPPNAGNGAGGTPPPDPPSVPPNAGPGDRLPLLVVFIDENSGERRAIVQAERGRIEVEAMGSIDLEAVFKEMSTELDKGATLKLQAAESTRVYENGAGTRFMVTGFEIEQPKAVSGKFVAHGRGGGAFDSAIIGRLRTIMQSTFDKIVGQKAGPRPPAAGRRLPRRTEVDRAQRNPRI
jgi:hypothetical protein